MEENIFKYIWRHSRREQLWIAGVVIASIPTYFLSLQLPKLIVNGPIAQDAHDYAEAPVTALRIVLPQIDWLGFPGATLFEGVPLDRLPHLILLCLGLLGLVLINGGFKFYINLFKGKLSERMLRRLRFQLVDHALRFPQKHRSRVKPAEIATMVNTEVVPLGGFVGQAFATPLFLLAQALTALTFIMLQNVALGLLAASIVALQVGIIPRIRRRLIVLAKMRQVAARRFAGRVAEIVESGREIRVNDASNWERADISHRLGEIYHIRYRFFRVKFFVKFLNNFLSQLTPFLFYLIGGYFAIRGQLDVGQLVAVIAAYRDLPPPIKELILWDQERVDVQVKYSQVIENFNPSGLTPPEIQAPVHEPSPRLDGPIAFDRVALGESEEDMLVVDATLNQPPGEALAIVGDDLRALEAVGESLARLAPPLRGSIRIGERDLPSLPDAIAGRRIAYVGPDVFYASATIRDALLYGLRTQPPKPSRGPATAPGGFDPDEARRVGNIAIDPGGDWLNRKAAAAEDDQALAARILETLRLAGLYEDVFEVGLNAKIDPAAQPELALKVTQARAVLRFWIEEEIHSDLVEPFDEAEYTREASIAANLIFGAGEDEGAREAFLLDKPAQAALAEAGVADLLVSLGGRIAAAMAELIEAAGDDQSLLRELVLIEPEEAEAIQTHGPRPEAWAETSDGRAQLTRLALRYIEPRDRLGLLDDAARKTLLAARLALRKSLGEAMAARFSFYEIDDYTPGATILENILFGRVRFAAPNARERLRKIILEMLEGLEMNDAIVLAGLSGEVGVGGRALNAAQRQRLALARALLKRPDVLILNRAFDPLGEREERETLRRLLAYEPSPPMTLVAALSNPALAEGFGQALVVRGRRVVERGDPAELLAEPASAYSALRRGDEVD